MSSSKKISCKGTLRQVFICLRPRTPYPPLPLNNVLAIYGPLIYMALYIMFLILTDPLRGQLGVGRTFGNRDYLGPEMATTEAITIWAQESLFYRSSTESFLRQMKFVLYN